jgi:hypothetical protein
MSHFNSRNRPNYDYDDDGEEDIRYEERMLAEAQARERRRLSGGLWGACEDDPPNRDQLEHTRIVGSSRYDRATPLPHIGELIWRAPREYRSQYNPRFVHERDCVQCRTVTAHYEWWYNHDPRNRVEVCMTCHSCRTYR